MRQGPLAVLCRAVDSWLESRPPIQFAIHFGDIVDGYCPKNQSETAVRSVLDQFGRLACPTYHMLGEAQRTYHPLQLHICRGGCTALKFHMGMSL